MDNENEKSKSQVPIWQKSNLTIEEQQSIPGSGAISSGSCRMMKSVHLSCGLGARD